MKAFHLIMLALLAPACVPASAAGADAPSAKSDTLYVIENPYTIWINPKEKHGQENFVLVYGKEGDPTSWIGFTSVSPKDVKDAKSKYSFSFSWNFQDGDMLINTKYNHPGKSTIKIGSDIYAGAAIPVDGDAGLSRAGWEIGMLNVAKMEWKLSSAGTALSLGIGWHYRHLTIGDGLMAARADNGAYTLRHIPEDYADVRSSLRNFAVQIPLLLRQPLGDKFAIELGAAAMLNGYTTGNTTWSTGNVSSKMPLKNLHQRILTIDVLVRVGWTKKFAFYVRYSPVALFKPQFGPQFNAVSVGGSIGF